LQGLAKTVAIELGPFGITSNAIAPGFIKTPMTLSTAERQGIDPDEFFAGLQAALPVRRVGLPEDIADTVAFLAAEEAGYLTGQVIVVDGGSGLV
jgi:3-oxoacyl-[acyl-carrier protein] reductase